MRITFVLPQSDLSGGNRVVAIYAEKLTQRGHTVLVVSQPPAKIALRRKLKSLLKGRGWPVTPSRDASHLDGRAIDHRVLDRCGPVSDADLPDADVIVATWWETAEWVLRLSNAKGAKAFFIQHYEAFDGLPKDRVDATWSFPMHKIVVARWLSDLARERFSDASVSLVPNSVDLEQFHALPRSKQTPPTVGMLYAPVYWKGADVSLRAYELASRRVSDLRLVAFGVEQPTAQLPLPAGASFTHRPAQNRVREIYSQCDAWLFGSRSEGFGLPLLEAMACRTPIIATPTGAAPELVAAGGGLLVRQDDPEDMASAIERVLCLTEPDWRSLSAKAHEVASSYTWDEATSKFEAALALAVQRFQHGQIGPGTSGASASAEARG